MSAQGSDFLELPHDPSRPAPSQKEVERIIEVFERMRAELLELGYPSFLHVFAPGDYAVRGRQVERHAFTLIGPIAGPVDLWRQAAVRSRS